MEIKRKFQLILLLFLFAVPVFAQSQSYYIDTESGFLRIVQRLSWSGGENALRYEVIIQRLTDGNYEPHLVETTTEHFIEVSLHPGDYRFQVIPYDMLNRSGEESEWVNIRVLQYQPELAAAEPDLEPEPEISPEMQKFLDLLNSLVIRVGAAWKPLVPLYGDIYSESYYPSGAEAHLSIIPITPILGVNIGSEITFSWYSLDNIEHNFHLGANILIVKWFSNERYALSLKLGGLFPMQSKNSPAFNIGGAFYWRIFSNFMLEIGFDYVSDYFVPKAGFSFLF